MRSGGEGGGGGVLWDGVGLVLLVLDFTRLRFYVLCSARFCLASLWEALVDYC